MFFRLDKIKALLAGAMVAAGVLGLGSGEARAAGRVETSEDFFPIAVWSQPIVNFDRWKARGVNTLMKYETYGGAPGHDISSWSNAANAKGFFQIRQPRENPADDLAETRLLAWMHDDEPDFRGHDPAMLAQKYMQWKAVDPAKPVLVNFSGGNVLGGQTTRAQYEQFMQSADWISNDFYPVTGWGTPAWIDYSKTIANRRTPGRALQTLADWSDGKPQWAIIETSNQRLSWVPNSRGVTRDEFRGELWHSIINGAQGVVYFPFSFNPFSFDLTPPEVVAEMTTQNARVQSVARILNASDSPTTDKISLANATLEAARRTYDGDDYFFVLNMSSATLNGIAVQLPGLTSLPELNVLGESRKLGLVGGKLTDSFGPWELHIYHADLTGWGLLPADGGSGGGTNNGSVPEPGVVMVLAVAVAGLGRRRRR